ncbi:MAG: hypothetical protein AMXMBFR49_21680 [Chlorobiota bacterium]
MKTVLFIADGPLGNPILQSQGIPHLIENHDHGINSYLLTFENRLLQAGDKKLQERHSNSLAMLEGKVNHLPVYVPFDTARWIMSNKILRALRFLLMILKGIFVTTSFVLNNRIDFIHCRSSYPAIIGTVVRFLTGCRIIYDNRGIPGEELGSGGIDIQTMLYKKAEPWLLKYSDRIVVVSGAFRDHLTETFKINGLAEKITVIENGYSPGRISFSEEKRARRREEEGLTGKLVMTYSGTLSKWQMFDEICEAYRVFRSRVEEPFFLVLTPDEEEAAGVIRSKGIPDGEWMIRNIKGNNLGDHLILGDFGTLFREKLLLNRVAAPIKFAEYLGAGLPVLISEGIGDTELFCRKGNVGVVFDLSDQGIENAVTEMKGLLGEPAIHTRCAEFAKENLSLKSAAEKYRKLYIS